MHSACAKIKVERSGEVERSPERSESMFVSVAFKKIPLGGGIFLYLQC